MSLVLITGISTSGKSSIAKELSRRGYEAYDTEHNGICSISPLAVPISYFAKDAFGRIFIFTAQKTKYYYVN